jgi:hypothetical protein
LSRFPSRSRGPRERDGKSHETSRLESLENRTIPFPGEGSGSGRDQTLPNCLTRYYGLSKLSPPTETHSIQTTSPKIRSSKIPHFFQIHNLDCLTRKICVIHIDLIFLLSLMDHFRSQQGYKGEDSKDGKDWPLTSLSPRLIVASRRCRVLLSSRLAVASCHRISLSHLAFTFRCHISSLCQFLSLH